MQQTEDNNQTHGKIGIFDIKRGFKSNRKNTGDGRTRGYPSDRLIQFLNVNSDNINEIKAFGEDYKFYFVPVGSTYKDGFEKYRKPILEIADYYLKNNDLTDEHIKLFNEQLSKITYRLTIITKNEIKEINTLLDPTIESFPIEKQLSKDKYFAFNSHHEDFYISLWEDLAKFIVKEQEIGKCISCGKYFVAEAKGHNRIYCSNMCRQRYKKMRKYHLKKKK